MKLRIATRGSDLALYQARRVARWIEERLGRATELAVIQSHGDRDGRTPIEKIGAVGIFTKELERALIDGEADLAVHSLKDLPTVQPPELCLAAIPERVPPEDLLIATRRALAPEAGGLFPLAAGARVGTSSRRRRVQILAARPDLDVREIRGNVPTRVEKLRRGDFDAVVMAAAGIERLGLDLTEFAVVRLAIERFVPAPGQGALAIEARAADAALVAALREKLHDEAAAEAVEAERRVLRLVEGGCTVPLGVHARRGAEGILLRAVLGPEREGPGPVVLRRALVRAGSGAAAADLAFRILRPDPVRPALAEGALAGREILILRDPEDGAPLALALSALGARVACEPAIETRPLASAAEIEAAIAEAGWVLFASPTAVRLVAGAGAGPRVRRAGAIGPGTAAALAEAGIAVDLLAERADGTGLARAMLAAGAGERVPILLPAARGGRPELAASLRAAGRIVRELAVYETLPRAVPAAALPRWDAILVASPSGAEALPAPPLRAKLVAIGETTAAALRARDHAVAAVAERPTTAAMAEAIVAALR